MLAVGVASQRHHGRRSPCLRSERGETPPLGWQSDPTGL